MGAVKRRLAVAAGALALLAAAFLAGRFAAPTKTVTVTKTEFVDRVVTAEVVRTERVEGPVRTVTRWRDAPAAPGCPEVREVEQVEERGPVTSTTASASTSASETVASTETTRVVERDRARLRLELSQDVTRLTDPKALGGAASARVYGPFWLGAHVTAEDWKRPRVTLGAEF